MKIYLCIVGILYSALTVSAQCDEPFPVLKKLFDRCGQENGLLDAFTGGPPNFDDSRVKCFSACVLKNKGSLVNGKLLPEKAMECATAHNPDVPVATIKAYVDQCVDQANQQRDDCSVGGAYFRCLFARYPPPKPPQ